MPLYTALTHLHWPDRAPVLISVGRWPAADEPALYLRGLARHGVALDAQPTVVPHLSAAQLLTYWERGR